MAENNKDRILGLLAGFPDESFSSTTVAEFLHIHHPTVTAELSELSRKGLIVKQGRNQYQALPSHAETSQPKTPVNGCYVGTIEILSTNQDAIYSLLKDIKDLCDSQADCRLKTINGIDESEIVRLVRFKTKG